MKKTILIVLAIFGLSVVSKAQLTSGTFFAGGSLGYQSSSRTVKVGSNSSDDWKSTTITFSPSVGYFIADRTAIGIVANFSSNTYINYQPNGDKTTTTGTPINVSIFARRFVMLNDAFGFFGGVNVGPSFGSNKTEDYDFSAQTTTTVENKLSGFNANLNAGTIWFPTTHIGIEASVGILGYSVAKSTQKNSNPEISSTEKGLNFGVNSMNLNFGFHYYFF
jgi:outer membrane protein